MNTSALRNSLYEARDLSKTYGLEGNCVKAVDGLTFSIGAGELVVITGPSGSGKSSLLNLLGLLSNPSDGELKYCDQDITELNHKARAKLRNEEIGFVFQSFQLLARTSAMENVELPLLYAGIEPKARRNRVREALDRVGLAHRTHHQSAQLSGGEQQRVAIARAIVNRPKVILADEPTGALDTRSGQDVLAILRELNHQGTTVIIITHNLDVAEPGDTRIELMDGALKARPQHYSMRLQCA